MIVEQNLTIVKGDDATYSLYVIADIPFYTESELKALALMENLDLYSYIMKNYATLVSNGRISVIDLSEMILRFSVRKTLRGELLFQKASTTGDIEVIDAENGLAEVSINAADTETLLNVDTDYLYDLEITKANGKKETIMRGKLRVLGEVTY